MTAILLYGRKMIPFVEGGFMIEYAVIGKSLPRIDADGKATGKIIFGSDMALPRMLHGKVLRSPYPHAKILNINTKKAERVHGVKAVITAEDTPKIKYGISIEDESILAPEKVRYIGDEVVATAAIDEDTAEEALDLIEIEYEKLPPVFDPEEAMEANAPKIHDAERNIALYIPFKFGHGEKGFLESDYVFEDRFVTPPQQHCPLETHVCLASFDNSSKLTLWATAQNIFMTRSLLSKALGMTEGSIRVIQTPSSGSYGGKFHMHSLYPIAALLAKKAGRPVRFMATREEEFIAAHLRHPMIIGLKTGVKKTGELFAKELKLIVDNGAYTDDGIGPAVVACKTAEARYHCPNIKINAYLIYTNKPYGGAFRGYGNLQMTFAVESQMDMIAERLGIDPLELRLKNARKRGDVTPFGWKIDDCGLRECIQKVAENTSWKYRRKKSSPTGIGMACMAGVSGARAYYDFDGSAAVVKINEDGKVNLISGEGDIGQGATTTIAQIVAEELGLPLEDVAVSVPDTDIAPYCLGAYGGRLTFISGNAAKLAAEDVRRQLFHAAAEMLEANIEDLEIKEKRIYIKGSPEKGVSLAEVAKACQFRKGGYPIIGKGAFDADTELPDRITGYGNQSPAYIFAAQVAELEADKETGLVKLTRITAAHDLGRTINPMNAKGQIEGALAQGIGFSLTEEILYQEGLTLNPSFSNYGIPTVFEMPAIEISLMEREESRGPFGAKGVGESALTPLASAITNAIYDAVGVRIKTLPITPDKIVDTL